MTLEWSQTSIIYASSKGEWFPAKNIRCESVVALRRFTSRRTGRSSGTAKCKSYGKVIDRTSASPNSEINNYTQVLSAALLGHRLSLLVR